MKLYFPLWNMFKHHLKLWNLILNLNDHQEQHRFTIRENSPCELHVFDRVSVSIHVLYNRHIRNTLAHSCLHWLIFLCFLLFWFSKIPYFETYLLHLCLLSDPKIEVLLIQILIQTILIGMLSSLRLNFPSRKNLCNGRVIHDQLSSVIWIQIICLFLQGQELLVVSLMTRKALPMYLFFFVCLFFCSNNTIHIRDFT